MGTTYSTASPAVSGGVVYTESNDDKLFAFDANGSTGCSGTPATCTPLWTAALSGTPDDSSPAVANGAVYAPSSTLQAFDANGVTNCSGTPKTCTPLRSYNVTVLGSSPSVANGLVFIGSTTNASPKVFGVEAFDATGHADCSGTPTVCSPLWTGATGGPLTASPAIANGKVYADDSSFGLGFPTDLYGWVLPPPTTAVILPSNGATVSGTDQGLDASASAGVTGVQYELTGGTLNHSVIATATLDHLRLDRELEHDERSKRHLHPAERRLVREQCQRYEFGHHRSRSTTPEPTASIEPGTVEPLGTARLQPPGRPNPTETGRTVLRWSSTPRSAPSPA